MYIYMYIYREYIYRERDRERDTSGLPPASAAASKWPLWKPPLPSSEGSLLYPRLGALRLPLKAFWS